MFDLREALPPPSCIGVDEIETQTRATIHLLIDRTEKIAEYPLPCPEEPTTCPNCGTPVESLKSPYCGDECREYSAFIRQFRNGLITGSLMQPDKQIPLGQKLWRILGGGLPARVALVQGRTLERVIEKKGGMCENCGARATIVDNIGGG